MLIPFLLLAACTTDGGKPDDSGGDDTAPLTDDFCGVRTIFDDECTVCHNATAYYGQLDLETDPYTAIVGVTGKEHGKPLVTPGDVANSFLYTKMMGTQGAGEGDVMPTSGSLGAVFTDVVKIWIENGAPEACDQIDTDTSTGPYHPPGFDDPTVHGIEAKFQEQDCLACHGSDLSGGSAGVACDDCHTAGWETDCTYCHGGVETDEGAPPEDIDDSTTGISFPEHTSHVTQTEHAVYDCVQCHTKPTEALSTGHFLVADATAGVSELTFTAGLSASATYGGAGSCSNLYCHGDGRTSNGTAHTGESYGCNDCHQDATTSGKNMSGRHDDHMEENVQCGDCHPQTVSGNSNMVGPDFHVDGVKEVKLPAGITWDSAKKECNGSCHDENHRNEDW